MRNALSEGKTARFCTKKRRLSRTLRRADAVYFPPRITTQSRNIAKTNNITPKKVVPLSALALKPSPAPTSVKQPPTTPNKTKPQPLASVIHSLFPLRVAGNRGAPQRGQNGVPSFQPKPQLRQVKWVGCGRGEGFSSGFMVRRWPQFPPRKNFQIQKRQRATNRKGDK